MTFDHKAMFEALQSSGVEIRYKDESLLMKLIGKIMFFNTDFMTHFTTTLGSTVYYPSRSCVKADYRVAWEVLAHELVHVYDYRLSRPKWLFMVKYAFPQWLAVLAILAPILWSWWPLLALVFLAPLPAPWRKEAEMRGYAMTMGVWYWYHQGGIPIALKEEITSHFTGPEYYYAWAWPTRSAEAEVGRWSKRVLCNEMSEYGAVYDYIKNSIQDRLL